ncbi:MAG: RNA methyltransferase [Clostridia bacterium]|nr:RNA methyltransferase [Clostridia bacterium]
MNFKKISSKDNSLIKLVSSLQTSAKARRENGMFVLEGLRVCDDANICGIMFDKLILTESFYSKNTEVCEKFAKNSSEVYLLDDKLFKKISDTTSPQGIIAICKTDEIKQKEFDKAGKYIALENLSDPSNLGAISRTAEALGISGIILSDNSCDPLSPKVLRASMGTILRLPLYISENIMDFIKQNNLVSYSCVVDRNAEKITDVKFEKGSVVLIGNEANGLNEQTVDESDFAVTIPMNGVAESLNASVAAAIAMWEMMR